MILITLLSCWLLNYDDFYPNWVELRVYGKTLMMNYEGDLVSLMILIIYFKLWLIVFKSWCCIGVWLLLQFIGWYDVELRCLDCEVLALRCKYYKEGQWFIYVSYHDMKMLMCWPYLYGLWWKELYSCNYYWDIMMMII